MRFSLFFLLFFTLSSCVDKHSAYNENLLVFKELNSTINTYFQDPNLIDLNISDYYLDDFIFHSYPAGYKKGQETIKVDYINNLKAMKSMGYILSIGHSIYLPGIDQETFELDGSVRLYYGASIGLDTNTVEFSGYQTINFYNGKISEIWEWADYGGVKDKLMDFK